MSDPTAIPSQIADYRVVGELAEGEHGRFLVAEAPARLGIGGDGRVALKLIGGGDDAAFRRFTRELRLFARVDTGRLVRLYDAGQFERWFFYSMELAGGGSLEHPATELDRAAKWRAIAQAAEATEALHEAGIAHRDIRPGNVLLRATADGSTDACLADLTIAQFGSGSMTSMAPLGSIGYIDPSLLLGESAGRATDIYSLGAVAHRVITGEHLFPIDTSPDGDVMMAVRAVLRRPPQVRTDALSDDEAALVAACVDRDRERRPETAAEVAALAHSLADKETAG